VDAEVVEVAVDLVAEVADLAEEAVEEVVRVAAQNTE
jgi:hypothetical protein